MRVNSERQGLVYGVVAYTFWAVFPLYFLLVAAASSIEIIWHRIAWSLVFSLVGVLLVRQWRQLLATAKNWRYSGRLAIAGVLVATNWFLYVYSVQNGMLVDASMGYFVNPLVTALLAIIFLGERPRALQLTALAFGSSAVVVISIWYGQIPWMSLSLAFSFGFYGLIKKQVSQEVPPLIGLTLETAPITPIAVGFIIFLQVTGTGTLTSVSPLHTVALCCAGIVTAGPLLLYAASAKRIPLTTLGLLQYICPIGQFLLAITVFGEAMPPARWIGFVLVWIALIILTADLLVHHSESPKS